MSRSPRVLFVVPPVRLQGDEFDYLIHLPRHAIVLAAELGDDYETRILDVSAEFHADQRLAQIVAENPSGTGGDQWGPLAQAMQDLVIDRIGRFRPDILVVHAHAAPHLPIVKLTFDAIIDVLPDHPNMKVVVGGMAATHLTQAVADWAPSGTWIVQGEGTGRVKDLFELLLDKRPSNPFTESLTTIKGQRGPVKTGGVSHGTAVETFQLPQETSAHVLHVHGNPPIMDYPLPRFDLLPMQTYSRLFQEGEFVPHLELGSGCTYRCKFCGVHYLGAEGRYRRRPAANVIEEMKHLRDTYGYDEFYFCDETFTLDKKHARELCERIIKELPRIRWRCVTRVDEIDDELAQIMFNAGCFEIGFGVEVGSNKVLLENTKDATVDLNVETIHRVQRIGIDANALTIIGMPQEDHCDIRRTFEFLARDARPNRCQIFVFHPVPGTDYFRMPEAYGLRFDTRDVQEWYKWDHIGEPVCETRYLSREDIARYFMLFNRAFATIISPEPDVALIERVLNNRFPVRRKGVCWQFDGDGLRIYKASDPSRNILNNSIALEFSNVNHGSQVSDQVRMAELILSRCNGLLTRAEIGNEVQRLYHSSGSNIFDAFSQIMELLVRMDIVSEF